MSGRPKLYRRYEVLEEIRKDPRVSIRELCARTGIKAKSQIVGLLKELEDEGLITRSRLARSIQLGGVPAPVKSKAVKSKATVRTVRQKPARKPQEDMYSWSSRKQTDAELQAAIERVVRKAQNAGGVDVVHDFRSQFGGRVRATKLG